MLEKNLTPSYVAEKKFPQTKFPQTKSLKYPPPHPLLKSRMFDPLDMWLVKTALIIAHMNQRKPF